jgi:hypothetical protein
VTAVPKYKLWQESLTKLFIACPGWGQVVDKPTWLRRSYWDFAKMTDLKKLSAELGWALAIIENPRRSLNWLPTDDTYIIDCVAEINDIVRPEHTTLAAFSDSWRPVARTAHRWYNYFDRVVCHSGMFHESDYIGELAPNDSWKLVTVEAEFDRTPVNPYDVHRFHADHDFNVWLYGQKEEGAPYHRWTPACTKYLLDLNNTDIVI